MTLFSTRLVSELQYYFNKFVTSSIMNKGLFPIPAPLRIEYFDENKSFIRMLFDDTWDSTSYVYMYIREDTKGSWPLEVQTRLNVYPTSGQYYICTTNDNPDGVNIFSLCEADLIFLDELLLYRLHGSSPTFASRSISDAGQNLGKLIYIYLDLMYNQSYEYYDNTTLISSQDDVLECCYEAYVSEAVFKYISSQEVQLD
jgi:hypothetical protein